MSGSGRPYAVYAPFAKAAAALGEPNPPLPAPVQPHPLPHLHRARRWRIGAGAAASRWLHRPWDAPAAVLHGAGLELGQSYPLPVIDRAAGRARALAAFAAIGGRAAGEDG